MIYLVLATLLIWGIRVSDSDVAVSLTIVLPLLGMFYHRAIQRIQGLKAGSASAWDQFMKMLQLTPSLHHIGDVDIEATHDDNASADWYTLRVANHNEGPPEQATWCPPNTKANRTPKSFALVVGKAPLDSAGDAHFLRDTQTKRYAMGTVRWGTATADSEAGSPPTVQISDDAFSCTMTAEVSGFGSSDPGIKSGDPVAYVIEYDGTPVTFGGAGGVLKKGTAVAKAREGDTTVTVTNDLSGDTHTVYLANTPAGKTPNINAGAKVIYGRVEDGNYWCVSDYTDDPVGTVKGWRFPEGGSRPAAISGSPDLWINDAGSWRWHSESESRNLPNCGDDAPFTTIGSTGGSVTHIHSPHELSIDPHLLTFTSQTVVSSADLTADFDNCSATVTATTTTICVLAGVN